MENKFILGAIDSPIDLRDYDYSMISCSSEKIKIPKEYVLDYDYPILNQGLIGSCVAHALSCMKSYIDGTNANNMYSVGFIYANRQEDDFQGRGMITREALKNLVKYGDCKKSSFPINEEYPVIVETLNKYGKEKLLDEADDHKSLAYISLDRENIKDYLVKYQKPVLITVRVYDNFYEANINGGIIPSKPIGNKRGGHAMLCVGYKDDTLIIINSWGDYNGDKGKYYLDINSNIIKELWVLEDKKQVKEPEKKKYKVGWNKNIVNGILKWSYSKDGLTLVIDDWIQIGHKWYYLNENAYAIDGDWLEYKGNWYFFLVNSCEMVIGWKQINQKWFYFNSNGAMQTGWLKDNDKWYYLNTVSNGYKGEMYCNGSYDIDGKTYKFDSSGAWIDNLISDLLVDFVKSYEGFFPNKYICPAGVWTIGYGTTKQQYVNLGTCTKEQATTWLKEEIESMAKQIKADLDSKNIKLKQNEFDSLCSFAYNCGVSALLGSTLYKRICAGVRDSSLKDNFTAWSYANGAKLQGLYNRRVEEYNMFMYGDYKRDL